MKDWPKEVQVVMQALRVGDVGIAAIPNEVFAEMGLEIKRRSPIQPTFNIELANGWYGYLPTVAQHKLGGYESWRGSSLLEKEAAPKMVEVLMELLREVAPPK
jgi:hypothetical protein